MTALYAAGALALGAFVGWNGLRTWQGREYARVEAWERANGRRAHDGRNVYGSRSGSSFIGLLVAPLLLVVGATQLALVVLDRREAWPATDALHVIAAVPAAIGAAFFVAYRWFGVPDALRPPAQRGWERGRAGELERVR